MAEYYRTHFTVEGVCTDADVQGMELMSRVEGTVGVWASRRRVDPCEERDDGSWVCENGASLIVDRGKTDSSGFCRLVLQHPDDQSETTTWRSDFRLATDGVSVEVEVEVRRIRESEEAPDTHGDASRPNVLMRLCQDFLCSFDGKRLTTEAEEVSGERSDQFVSSVLTDPARRIPIVVVVNNIHGGVFMGPSELQSRLIGLANVYTYDNRTAKSITQQTSEYLGCWDGTIRVFRPGFTLQDRSNQNLFWTWARMNYIVRSQGWDQLLIEISDECQRHSLPQAGQRLYDAVSLQVKQAQSRRLLDIIRKTAQDEQDESALEELLNETATTIEGLQDQNSELRQRFTALEGENDQLRSQVEQLGIALAYQGADDPEPTDEFEELPPEFNTVFDVVRYAEEHLSGIRFFSIAKEFAKGSQFRRSSDVHDVFQALNECAAERSQGSLRRDVQEWLSDRGIAYSPHESQSTMGKYGDKRKFRDEIAKVQIEMQEHVKLGGGSGEHNLLRIHTKWEPEECRWLIGCIGRHLPTASG